MSKYGNVRTEVDGITFASKAEARRYQELVLLEQMGDIVDLELQPRYPLWVNGVRIGTYVADFWYRDRAGAVTVEDVKGCRTSAYVMKRRLMKAIYGLEVKEICV